MSGKKVKGGASPDGEPSGRRSLRERLETAGLVLAVAVGVLTILGSVLDLPGQWRGFWGGEESTGGEGSSQKAPLQEQPARSIYELRLVSGFDGQPLAGVEVTIPELGLSATSDEHGVARFGNLPVAAETMLRVRAALDGFAPREQEVTVGLGNLDQWRLVPREPQVRNP